MARPIRPIELTRVWPESVWRPPVGETLGIPPGADEVHFERTMTPFPFASVRSVRALAIIDSGHDPSHADGRYPYQNRRTVYGVRTLTNCREDGYCLRGQVSIRGRKYRAFTSDMLVFGPGDRLCKMAILYVCSGQTDPPTDYNKV